MPGETMTDEGYGVLGVSWTLTHDLTHVGCTYMAGMGEVAEVCCSWEKVSVLKNFLSTTEYYFLYCIVSHGACQCS